MFWRIRPRAGVGGDTLWPMREPATTRVARLALPDGSVFVGRAFGDVSKVRTVSAEVVFNTALTGYQESLTDPSYCGQALVMTTPLIGNYGVNLEDLESARAQVTGFIVRELAQRHSNYRATEDLSAWLAREGVLGITGVDTRALTRMLRVSGVTAGILSSDESVSDGELVRLARSAPRMDGQNLVPKVGCSSRQGWSETLGDWGPGVPRGGRRWRVAALDCGAKRNILRNLSHRGCEVSLWPHESRGTDLASAHERGEIDGLFVSNGPGDPAAVKSVIGMLREVVCETDKPLPTFGICLGHQLLSLAMGAKTYKLKFGHRGTNQPVRNLLTGRVEITSQNHGFAVDAESLKGVGGQPTHINLNDGSLAGFRMPDRPVFAVQHHPEASPGPHDSAYLFDAFVRMMEGGGPVDEAAMGWGEAVVRPVGAGAARS